MVRTLRMTVAAFAAVLALLAVDARASDVRVSLIRAGLSPEDLAASGVIGAQVAEVVDDLRASGTWTRGDLEHADAAYRAARGEVDRLTRLIQSGLGSEADVAALATAQADLAAAEAGQAAALDALHAAGVESLAPGRRNVLATLRGNEERKVPIEFRAVTREGAGWYRLKRLLAHERICGQTGETPDSELLAELADLRSDPDVAGARANLDANLVAVSAAWDAATEE